MIVISSSYGNDSLATIQWAYENALDLPSVDITVVFCDTGWAAPGWNRRIALGEAFARSKGFKTINLTSMGMSELVQMKKGWPGNGQQFCTAFLKGLPFLTWIDDVDPDRSAVIMIGKRRAESAKRASTPEFVESSEYHGGRKLHHPLYLHTNEDRNDLLLRAGISHLPDSLKDAPLEDHDRLYILEHRSLECNPCVNANRADFLRLTGPEIARVSDLEVTIGKPMFRPKRFNAVGIFGVVAWAKYGKNHEEDVPDDEGCGAPFGCGL